VLHLLCTVSSRLPYWLLVSFSDFLAGFYPKNHIGKLFPTLGVPRPISLLISRDFETGQNWFLQVALECHWLLPNYSLIVWGKVERSGYLPLPFPLLFFRRLVSSKLLPNCAPLVN